MSETIIERFKIKKQPKYFEHYIQIMLDDKEISIPDLVNLANQLASALNDSGCFFEVKNNEKT